MAVLVLGVLTRLEKKLVKSLSIELKEEYDKIKTFEDFVAFSQKISVQSMEHITQTIDQLEQEIRQELPRTGTQLV